MHATASFQSYQIHSIHLPEKNMNVISEMKLEMKLVSNNRNRVRYGIPNLCYLNFELYIHFIYVIFPNHIVLKSFIYTRFRCKLGLQFGTQPTRARSACASLLCRMFAVESERITTTVHAQSKIGCAIKSVQLLLDNFISFSWFGLFFFIGYNKKKMFYTITAFTCKTFFWRPLILYSQKCKSQDLTGQLFRDRILRIIRFQRCCLLRTYVR